MSIRSIIELMIITWKKRSPDMIYLVEARIHYMKYEEKDGTFYDKTLVEADNSEQVREKYEKYWAEQKDKYYSVVEWNNIDEIKILK